MKNKTHSRVGTLAESMQHRDASIPIRDYDDIALADGNPNAIRIMFDVETGEPLHFKDGSLKYCAPWLLAGTFSV